MNLFSLFAIFIYASETILSPLADGLPPAKSTTSQPTITFGKLLSYAPPTVQSILGDSTAKATPTPTPVTYTSRKTHYTIALLGDSMIDTLGPTVPNLTAQLTNFFPSTKFSMLNYGVGGTNIDYGLQRLTQEYSYLGKTFPPLISTKPDIVVVESFAYNPYSSDAGALDKHWLQLAAIINTLKKNIPGVKIIIAATIAPNSLVFADGAPGISLSIADKLSRTNTIKQYLDSTVKFAISQRLPLADAYHASLDVFGNGRLAYISPTDHIHYSEAGRVLFAQKLADAIVGDKLLE